MILTNNIQLLTAPKPHENDGLTENVGDQNKFTWH